MAFCRSRSCRANAVRASGPRGGPPGGASRKTGPLLGSRPVQPARANRSERSSMIDVGLIGFGLGGKAFHAPVISAVEGLRLAAVLERHENRAAEIYPGVKTVRSVEGLLAIPSIKLVAISTPNDTHFSYAKACLEADRDVVVDKPFTTTLAEGKELAE